MKILSQNGLFMMMHDENNQMELHLPVRLRRSTSLKKLAQRALESMEQEGLQSNVAYSAQ
eukprot:5050456-Ditylum_brightwellii.AAC.1